MTDADALQPAGGAGAESAIVGSGVASRDGFAVLGADGVAIHDALERRFRTWAATDGAPEVRLPFLMRAGDLQRFDYFRNFPHLGLCACALQGDRRDAYASGPAAEAVGQGGLVPAADLDDARFVLPPAACYPVYLELQGQALDTPVTVTTVAHCFRNEDHFDTLRRLRGFTMREIVHVGTAETVRAHLDRHRGRVADFAAALGLDLAVERATDPFFDRQSERALMAQLFPTKEEFVHGGSLAIASLNYHRNFFGERCGLTIGGEVAHTGCVAFGLERWIQALMDVCGGDPAAVRRRLEQAEPPAAEPGTPVR